MQNHPSLCLNSCSPLFPFGVTSAHSITHIKKHFTNCLEICVLNFLLYSNPNIAFFTFHFPAHLLISDLSSIRDEQNQRLLCGLFSVLVTDVLMVSVMVSLSLSHLLFTARGAVPHKSGDETPIGENVLINY